MATDLASLAKALSNSSNDDKPKTLYPRPVEKRSLKIDDLNHLLSNDALFLPSFDNQRLRDTDFGRSGVIYFDRDTLKEVLYVAREEGKKDQMRITVSSKLVFSNNGEEKSLVIKLMTKEMVQTVISSDESPFYIDQWKIGDDWASKDIVPKLEFGMKPAQKKDVPA